MADLAAIERRLAEVERRLNEHLKKTPTMRIDPHEMARAAEQARKSGRGT